MGSSGREPDPRDDATLVAAVRTGEVAAFEELYRRHRDWVARLAGRIVGNEADALDVVQETFLYVLRKAPELVLQARFTTFLWPVVRNLALQRRRGRRRDRGEGGGGVAVPEPAVDDPQPGDGDLVDALGGLSEALRAVVLLRYVDGLTLQEIAAALQVPLGTVKSRLHQALTDLRDDPSARRWFLDP